MADLIADGSNSFLGGQDASKIPDRIAKDAYWKGVNVTTANGSLSPRWGNTKRNLTFPSGGIEFSPRRITTYKTIFTTGRVQALIPHFVGTQFYLIAIINGVMFLINQDSYEVQIIEVSPRLNENLDKINWSIAAKYIVIFDFPDFPVIIDKFEARRSNPDDNEVPISVLGAYNQNRLFVANAGNEFTAGDPAGSLFTPNAPITFNELVTPASNFFGQIFQLPTDFQSITAMTFLQNVDSSTGIGQLLVSTKDTIHSFNTVVPRAEWQAGQFGTMFTYNAGIVGSRAYTNVNSDLFFASSDGQIRTASMSRDEQKKWSKIPISREVKNWLKYWDKSLAKFCIFIYFKNKILVSCNPYRVEAKTISGAKITDYAHGGFVVLNLDNISTLGETGRPVWDGLWTGIRPTESCINNERLFVMSKDFAGVNNLYEILPETTIDVADGNIRYVESIVYTREYDFESGFQDKTIHSADFFVENIQGDFELDVKYKPSQSEGYLDWRTFKHNAPWRDCNVPLNFTSGYAGHQFKTITIGSPNEEEGCNPVNQDLYRNFRKIQLKLKITGKYWEIHEFKLKATMVKQLENQESCDLYPVVSIPKGCDTDWNIGVYESCQQMVT